MSKKKTVLIIVSILLIIISIVVAFVVFNNQNDKSTILPDEGKSSLLSSDVWLSSADGKEHEVQYYSLGNTAESVSAELSSQVTIEHKFVDDIPIYEMRTKDINEGKMIIFLHGQASRKEEYLNEMMNYLDLGYVCVCVDLLGHGERMSNKPIMSYEIVEKTSDDIDVLLDYYETITYVNSSDFALVGFSQGGSVVYYYSAFGRRTPKVIVVGSSTPDYKFLVYNNAITNGTITDSIWDDDTISEYIKGHNPVSNIEKFYDLPILSGNGMDDVIVSYKGAETFEKLLKDAGNADINFFYYSGLGHDVPNSFAQKSIKFIEKYL